MDCIISPINVHSSYKLNIVTKHESRNTKVSIFKKENVFYFGFHYYCKTDIDEARVISFLGVRTDSQTNSKNFNSKKKKTQKISTQISKLRVSCRSLYASPDDGDA